MEKKVLGKHSSMNGFAMMKGRVATVVLASALLLGGGLTAQAQNAALTTCSQSAATAIPQNPNWKANAAEWQKLKGEITLYMTNDMGRNGYYDQKSIAELMGEMAGTVDPECVLAVGDIHHFNGVTSTQDPLWLTNYEYVYSHPDLMLNCVGLQNKGVEYFCSHIYPQIKDIDTNMIVNVSGHSPESYAECAARINELDKIPAIELNISCPNVKDGGMAFGVTCEGAASVVKAVRKVYKKTLIVKLSPNVTSIADIARAVEAEGADSVSLINTLMGMAVDIEKRQPLLSIRTGGLSGPCVKPVALRMVWDVAHAVNIPVVGLGGISSAKDAIEFLMCGATAIEIGTANFIDPAVTKKVKDGINEWLDAHGCKSVTEIIGAIK